MAWHIWVSKGLLCHSLTRVYLSSTIHFRILYGLCLHVVLTDSADRAQVWKANDCASLQLASHGGADMDSRLLEHDMVSTGRYGHFGGSYCLHPQGYVVSAWASKMEAARYSETSVATNRHDIISQKT